MLNFTYCNPTRIVFGRGTRFELGREAAAVGTSALVVSGSGSAVRSGYYAAALGSLKAHGVKYLEMPGVSPNPLIEDCERAAALCREHRLGMLVAIGGGSVLDCCKAAAVGARNEGPIWDYFTGMRAVASALPVVSVMTVAATGSENDSISVVRNPAEGRKAGLMDPHLFPAVSILDPETTFTVPPRYTALGGFDIISHVLEPYIDGQEYPEIQMRFIEALVSSTMENIGRAQADPADFEARAGLMWASALACCDILSVGTGGGTIAAHIIEGEVGGRYDTPHGAGLSAILPAVMECRAGRYLKATVRFAKNLMRLTREPGEADEAFAMRGIRAFREWIGSTGNPTALREMGVAEGDLPALARQVNANSGIEYGETLEILRSAW
jgi:alcohol dehydrogenase YqhD (iron-dependent ADH family)